MPQERDFKVVRQGTGYTVVSASTGIVIGDGKYACLFDSLEDAESEVDHQNNHRTPGEIMSAAAKRIFNNMFRRTA